jgi:hypothetical protein
MCWKVWLEKSPQQKAQNKIALNKAIKSSMNVLLFYFRFNKEIVSSLALFQGSLFNMVRALYFLACCFAVSSFGQVRIEKLIVKRNATYKLGPSDILVADTLIMMDSSRIKLNELKAANYIRARVAIIGNNCVIDGRGVNGKHGTNGRSGGTPVGPCQFGGNGRDGSRGLDGAPGINLFLYIDSANVNGSLLIDLSGGLGADGGNGGVGGGGSPGTTHCNGGDGGNGGKGGNGGNGGKGGTLSLGGNAATQMRAMLSKELTVYNKGGSFGYGGIAGYGGAPGLGPDRKNGKPGITGSDGSHGRSADNGTILFENR